MEMPVRVIKNAIRCAYYGAKAKIAVDGGRELIGRRVLGYPSDWVNAAGYDPPEDPAEAAGDS